MRTCTFPTGSEVWIHEDPIFSRTAYHSTILAPPSFQPRYSPYHPSSIVATLSSLRHPQHAAENSRCTSIRISLAHRTTQAPPIVRWYLIQPIHGFLHKPFTLQYECWASTIYHQSSQHFLWGCECMTYKALRSSIMRSLQSWSSFVLRPTSSMRVSATCGCNLLGPPR